MLEKELLNQLIGVVYDTLGGIQMSGRHSSANFTTAVVVGVAVTAVAGVAVAVAVGGTGFLSDRGPFRKRWRRRRHHPLTQQQWEDFFGDEGRLSNNSTEKLIHKVRWGGIEPGIRAQAWPFLLGIYEVDSTEAERKEQDAKLRKEYEKIRSYCQEIKQSLTSRREGEHQQDGMEEQAEEEHKLMPFSESQIEAFSSINDSSAFWKKGPKAVDDIVTWQRIIRLDAVRMNAEWVPYSPSQANVSDEETSKVARKAGLSDDEHLETCRRYHAARLVSILEAYALYDPDTGYCQGMSDLLSPFVALMDDDHQAFWCFVSFMRTARHNFRLDEVGIRRQLNGTSDIIKVADPELYEHLVKIKAEDCTFVYRMVVVLFRRELTFEQTICLWEVIWADSTAMRTGKGLGEAQKKKKAPPTKDLLLYTIAAAVCRRRKFIMENCKGMDELLRECNAMAGNLDVWQMLDDARELVSRVHGRRPETPT
ncbi:GTPase-activating protein gyp7 isoform X1 [Selaginella moellendorffii]|nr:GTPase-activating protein gyp7 isoform X1 [Selaginella moellendorffii]|eukprot:XP_002969799.2 GTPase-activating protein gyp7 isoform X1 [Selaginella moellendorffii]